MGRKNSNIRWVLCAVNAATTVAAVSRRGVIRSIIFHRTTGSAVGTVAVADGAGTSLLNLYCINDNSTQLDLWDLDFTGLTVTNSTAVECWVGIISEGQSDSLSPVHDDIV